MYLRLEQFEALENGINMVVELVIVANAFSHVIVLSFWFAGRHAWQFNSNVLLKISPHVLIVFQDGLLRARSACFDGIFSIHTRNKL
jgi:hypothetical protein